MSLSTKPNTPISKPMKNKPLNKFSIDSNVRYIGSNDVLQGWVNNATVLGVIGNNCPIGNGETNKSGQYMYQVQNKNSKVVFLFLESELDFVD